MSRTSVSIPTLAFALLAAFGIIAPEVSKLHSVAGSICTIVGLFGTALGNKLFSSRFPPTQGGSSSAQLLVVGLLAGCLVLPLTACDDEQLQSARRAAAIAEITVRNAGELAAELARAGDVDTARAEALTSFFRDAAPVVREAKDGLARYKTLTPDQRRDVLHQLSDLSARLARLNDDGVLHIKNAERQRQIRLALTTLRTTLEIVRVFSEDNLDTQ